ncbi:Mobile element protein [Methanosarcina sp. MTP4]|uniref:IS1634 family transposase n=1 Tax=Methanosarcina sp. MTP4 TaxID=1434100 RepID=UPI000615B308|nr:IS1634 family transposase [Methanosarcina sp. MTP4]AKB23580.1 Mobile element protein [Methanosarcina sp. MTP4]AKB24898.1 Mobile element protein [Methanosarcina sp. MTP4]AKB26705.1 Mobile element protein [Methanosarcina sp. MTP4]
MHFKIKTISGHKYLYVIKNERIDGKVVQTIQKYVGTADQVYDLIMETKETRIASYSFGKPAALLKAAEEVGLIEAMNKHIDRKSIKGLTPAEYLLLIIIGRSEHILSRNVLDEYFKESLLKFFWNPSYKLSSQNFLNYMERLDEETIRKIEIDVSRTLIQKGIRPTKLTFDTTNFYTHIEHGEELPKKGFSKDKRYDKNLIGVGLTTSNKNIPFQTITYPANIPDVTLFSGLIDNICKRVEEIEIPLDEITIVFDRGMNSIDNIEHVLDKMHVVGALPSSMCKDLFQIPLSDFEEEWENGKNNIIKAHRIMGKWYEQNFTGAIKYSEITRRKQMHEWETKRVMILEKIEELRSRLNHKGRGRKMTSKGLMNRVVDTVPKQYRGLFDYNVIENEGKLQLNFSLNESREKEFLSGMGKTVVFTDKENLATKEIVEMYDSRNMIEEDIKWLKDRLLIPIKPVYVRKDVKIRAHVFLCVMGLLLHNYLLHLIDDPELTIQKLATNLEKIRMSLVYSAKEEKNAEFVIEEMNKETAKIFTKLQLGKYIPS